WVGGDGEGEGEAEGEAVEGADLFRV
ncbi:hypothetical protein O988_08635, partial [Pseudogymnoascus sp. VKM F-3808]